MKKIKIMFSDGTVTTVKLEEEVEPKLVEKLWKDAGKNQDYFCWQDIVGGQRFDALPVPELECPYIVPKKPVVACTAKPGQLFFDGFKIRCVYGKVTEPLEEMFGYVGCVTDEDLEAFELAGIQTGNEMLFHHKVVKVRISRVEE